MLNKSAIVSSPTRRQQWTIRLLIGIGVLSIAYFSYYFFFDERYYGHPLLFGILAAVLIYGLVRDLSLWYYYAAIKVPETPKLQKDFTVDVLTTFYPGEPYDMIKNTLRAIQDIQFPHTTYLCDEANDPHLKEFCAELGIIHATREVRVNAKAGNINNALRQATGDLCLVLDPDHIPAPDFLDHIVPHFQDEKIGFVQTVQAYYNKFDTLVAKGSAQQTFHFYGPMMMTMNSYGTVNAIGANCTFRRSALDSIGGHAPGLAEDMHTAMRLYSKGWKSVYVPRILAKGLVPASLTAYFKQQIKWSRGVFDLLVKVYPRIFGSITWRQRLHYALMPIHYLAGIFYLLGFLIPVLSLVLSDVPWTGNFFYFLLLIGPVLFTSFVLRFYIQKWLISDDERGFHIVGGILEILTWWIFTLGFVYTLFNKKIPYLPTPKNDDDRTHFTLLIPNLLVGVASLGAIAYGLPRDLTPFSLVMAGFALLNAIFMFFTVYLAYGVTNRIDDLPAKLPPAAHWVGRYAKRPLLWSLDAMTVTVRRLAPILLLMVVAASLFMLQRYNQPERYMEADPPVPSTNHVAPKLGIFFPGDEGGLTDISYVQNLEEQLDVPVEIISAYIPWSGGTDTTPVAEYLRAVIDRNAIPLITWEPWVSKFADLDPEGPLARETNTLAAIAAGRFDDYVIQFARKLRDLEQPVYLRFAHEFDNPAYPWSASGGNSPEDFRKAWRRVHQLFRQSGAHQVMWVWNPWRPADAGAYYPGSEYVDLLGLTTLNYGPASDTIPSLSFTEIYAPFRELIDTLGVNEVMLAEFGTLGSDAEKTAWIQQARTDILEKYPEITVVVAFNSGFDRNVPVTDPPTMGYLDWRSDPVLLFHPLPEFPLNEVGDGLDQGPRAKLTLQRESIRAIGYKKGAGWRTHLYIPSRDNLERDFAQMQSLGINAIRITDPGIYAHNLFTIAPEYGIDIVFNLWVPEDINFLQDTVELAELKEEILETVREHADRDALLHWSFSNDPLHGMEPFYLQPELDRQRVAYLKWLYGVMGGMREIDPRHAIMQSIVADQKTQGMIERFGLLKGGSDLLGLTVTDSLTDEVVPALLSTYPGELVISEISPPALSALPPNAYRGYRLITNWQNEWRQGAITFDGLLDFQGRFTESFALLGSRWDRDVPALTLPEISFIAPARLPYTGSTYNYRATLFQEGGWVRAPDGVEDEAQPYTLEWRLIRNDIYGNPVAMTLVGKGARLDLVFPDNHLQYQLMLTVTDGVYSRSVRKPLLVR